MSEPVRPVNLEVPQAGQKWVNTDGTPTHYGHRWHHAVFMRLGAYNDDVWRALGVGFTGLTQINQVNQRVNDLEAATAAVQGAVAGLRGDPRLEDAVKALEIAIVALVQVQARASGEADRRITDLDRLVSSLGARLTKAQQAVQFQSVEVAEEAVSTQRLQTAFIQRVAASQGVIAREVESLQGEVDGLTTTDVTEGTNLYYTDARADGRVAAAVGVSVQAYSANLDEYAGVNPTAAGLALLDDADAAAQRDTLGLATRTGWGAPTGTATRTTFDTATVTLPQLAERVKALLDDLTTSDLIGA